MIGVVAITWISGLDYIVVGWKQLRGRGDFARADVVRLVGALAMPILLFAVLVYTRRRAGRSSRSSRSSSPSAASTICCRTTRSRRWPSPGAAGSSASAVCSAARCS